MRIRGVKVVKKNLIPTSPNNKNKSKYDKKALFQLPIKKLPYYHTLNSNTQNTIHLKKLIVKK